MFEIYLNYLISIGVKEEQIVNINLENPNNTFVNFMELYNFINSKVSKNKNEKYYVFLDEIQVVPGFEKAVNGLHLNKNLDIYITGSNAFLLSSELATYLSGRYVEIKMLPLSFKEFLSAYNTDKTIDKYKLFMEYMEYGGMPRKY